MTFLFVQLVSYFISEIDIHKKIGAGLVCLPGEMARLPLPSWPVPMWPGFPALRFNFIRGQPHFVAESRFLLQWKHQKQSLKATTPKWKFTFVLKKHFFSLWELHRRFFFFFVMKPYATFASKTKIEDSLTSFMLVMISIHSVMHLCFHDPTYTFQCALSIYRKTTQLLASLFRGQ